MAMLSALDDDWGNPSSVHGYGRRARNRVEDARADVAALIGARTDDIVFTSGGTEADNLGIRGLAWAEASARGGKGPFRIVTAAIEHPAVQGACEEMAREGFEVVHVGVSAEGVVDLAALRLVLNPQTVLVSLALANHELGVVQPITALAGVARKIGAKFHTDAVQAVGRMPVSVDELGVDAMALSGHKIYGPKGVGALYVRGGALPRSLIAGGHQERERRAGTENVPGIVGFGVAARLAAVDLSTGTQSRRIADMRDRLETALLLIPGARVHGRRDGRVPGTTNLGFDGVDGQLLAVGLDLAGVCVSTGAACTSGSIEPSAVLLGLGLSPVQARQAVRFSVGAGNTQAQIDQVVALTGVVVARIRAAR